MSPSLAPQILGPTTVSVGSGSTTVYTFDTRYTAVLTVQITNLDGTQTFTGVVKRRVDSSLAFATSALADFSAIAPGETIVADLDTRGTSEVRITGAMSGAGGDVSIAARRRSA